ncbi:hypothetical protein [Robiginitalea aurantiaca]|uniref:Cytochrome c domain-containing protein n=1 Tax=Robiginitalea aurantiaca TaxID=3056915 RepID=A0ABT7WGP6_9FLAO|nr:hypothetical protein [Robiginitalea aurantiaca]MDM9632095.1 hypothetical protein [Robiginitalea aurantiaca]
MKKKTLQFLAGCLLVFGTACYYDTEIEEDLIPPPEDEITYTEDVQPIISRYNCTQCHNGLEPAPDLREESTPDSLFPDYVVPGDGAGSVFYQRLPGNGNHPNVGINLSNSEIDLIEAWIDRGALE